MNETIKELAKWIESMKDAAKNDEQFSVNWFSVTKDDPFAVVAGWMSGFSENYSDLLCVSKSNPEYAMCVKIVENDGPYDYTDFEVLNMPSISGEVEDTCIALEFGDNSEALATFIYSELERLTEQTLAELLGKSYTTYVS